MREGVEFAFPYDKSSFKDRYTRQSRRKPCSTIVAHLSKDGLMFIHPTQNRSLTPREAARIQSFRDWFQFPVAGPISSALSATPWPRLWVKRLVEVRCFSRRTQRSRAKLRKQPFDRLIPISPAEAAALQAIAGT